MSREQEMTIATRVFSGFAYQFAVSERARKDTVQYRTRRVVGVDVPVRSPARQGH